jgi:hypothetical protein
MIYLLGDRLAILMDALQTIKQFLKKNRPEAEVLERMRII